MLLAVVLVLVLVLVLRTAMLLLLLLVQMQTPVVVERPSLLTRPGLKQTAMAGKKASFRINDMG